MTHFKNKMRWFILLLAVGGFYAQMSVAQSTVDMLQAQFFAVAQSTQCRDTRGVEALYWDFSNGVIRVDYPETLLIPRFTSAFPYMHPAELLYNFFYPGGWQVETLFDQQTRLTGVNVIRADGQAVWRRINLRLEQNMTAKDVLDVEVPQILAHVGNPQNVTESCFFNAPDGSSASVLLRAGGFVANANAQVFKMPGLFGGVTSLVFAQVVVAPAAEYDQVAIDVFFPLTGQLMAGGGSDPECSDGIDNDGDNKTDYPADEGCSSKDDVSEAG